MAEFVPISQLPTFQEFGSVDADNPSPQGISWNFSLPTSLDTDRIVVDMGQLRRIQKAGAFYSTHVDSFDGDTEEYDYSIQGVNAGGTALMGLSKKVKPAEPDKVDHIDPVHPFFMRDYYWTSSFHTLNKPQMVEEVVKAKNGGKVSNEEAWASTLDDHLNDSIRSVARQHLLKRPDFGLTKPLDLMVIGAIGSIIAVEAANNDPVGTAVGVSILIGNRALNIVADSFSLKMKHGDSLVKQRRWSAFAGWQPDRYIAVDALTRVNSLIKTRK